MFCLILLEVWKRRPDSWAVDKQVDQCDHDYNDDDE